MNDINPKLSISKVAWGYQHEMYDCVLCENPVCEQWELPMLWIRQKSTFMYFKMIIL